MKKTALQIIGSVLMVLAPLVLITGIAYTMTLPRMYKAEVKLALHEDQADTELFIRQGKEVVFNPLYLRAQVAVLKSQPILGKVIDNLNLTKEWGRKFNEDKSPISRGLAAAILADAMRVQPYRDTSLISTGHAPVSPNHFLNLAIAAAVAGVFFLAGLLLVMAPVASTQKITTLPIAH